MKAEQLLLGSSRVSQGPNSTTYVTVIAVLVIVIIVMSDRVFTVYEAARELGVTSQWVRVLLAERRLAGAQKIEGQWRIPAAALEEIRQRQAVSA